jgi:hypothetical protein
MSIDYINGCNCTGNLNVFRGNGTVSNPFQICTTMQFSTIGITNLNSNYILCNDLDFSNRLFIPIGSYENPFTGRFNGNLKKIMNYNLYSSFPSNSVIRYIGLFRATSGAEIYNLIINTSINNRNSTHTFPLAIFVGSLIGSSRGNFINNTTVPTKINNIFATVTMTEIKDYFNGLIYEMENTELTNCVVNVNTVYRFGFDAVTGVAFSVRNSSINNLYVNFKSIFDSSVSLFGKSLSACASVFGYAHNIVFTNSVVNVDSVFPPIQSRNEPIDFGVVSSVLTKSNLTNIVLYGRYVFGTRQITNFFGSSSVTIGLIAGVGINNNLTNVVSFVNI